MQQRPVTASASLEVILLTCLLKNERMDGLMSCSNVNCIMNGVSVSVCLADNNCCGGRKVLKAGEFVIREVVLRACLCL